MPDPAIPAPDPEETLGGLPRSIPVRLLPPTIDQLRSLKVLFGVQTYDDVVARLLLINERAGPKAANDPAQAMSRIEKCVADLTVRNDALLQRALELERGTLMAQVQLCATLSDEIQNVRAAGIAS